MFRAVRLRLIAYVVAVLTIVLLAVGALVYTLLSRQLDAAVDAELRATASRVAAGPRAVAAPPSGGGDDGEAIFEVRLIADDFGVLGRRGARAAPADGWREVSRSGPAPAAVPLQEALDAARSGRDDLRTVTLDGVRYRLLTRELGAEGRFSVAIQTGVSLAARDRQERIVLLALAGGGLLGLALTVAGGLFLTGRALAPVREAFERQRRFVADASHELRTPLALLRLEADDLARRLNAGEETRPLVRQVDRLGRLVESLLSLARLDEGGDVIEREPVHVASLLRTAAAQAQRLAARGVRVDGAAPENLWASADPDRLHQVLLILVDNAARATPPGGAISLRGTASRDGLEIIVADTGPGIPAEHAARVFERFYRVDKARSRDSGGAGLGLSIAREVLRAHGGTIEIESNQGSGTCVRVRLEAVGPHPRPLSQ